ncbi:MAG: right-handed parallel beta-helix repeat-containing protein, partial [Clostridia bacterium]
INFAPTITMYFSEGKRYQACSSKRDASGTFMERCSDITLSGNTYHFMHGMGILAQLCNNLTVENCNFTPDYSRGRTTASFADMIHASMCKGLVKVVNCVFDGSRDDIINVHGNHFVIQKIKGNQMFVKFAHPQAYGFNAFDKGDIVEFVSPTTLLPIEQNEIVASELTSPRITKLTLKTAPSLKVKSGHCLENATNTASLYVDNIVGKNIPTRGILVTTRQSVVIKNSTFERLFMSGILMSDDAKGWYESGYVRDVTIDGNTFDNCLDLIVDIRPETKNLCCSKPVHKNILIKNNIIKSESPSKFFLKNVENVTFDHNTFEGNPNFIISKCHAKNITTIN